MIFNQQSLLLYRTENSEQKTMILIQGKRAIYFKYFCRMTEVIYSVIIRHIVKWTIVREWFLLAWESCRRRLFCVIKCCLATDPGARYWCVDQRRTRGKCKLEFVIFPFLSWKMLLFPLHLDKKFLQKVLELKSYLGVRESWFSSVKSWFTCIFQSECLWGLC